MTRTCSIITHLCVSALLMAHLACSYPTGTGMGSGPQPLPRAELQLLLQDLVDSLESLSEQRAMDVPQTDEELDVFGLQRQTSVPSVQQAPEGGAAADPPRDELDEALIRELLSAKNLKAVRNNSNRNSSGCFGRRMDRIGSMSSLGCNTVGRNNAKSP